MLTLIFLYHGLLVILAQLIIFRELSALFYGSELFLGTFLSSWLFWVGAGSLLIRRLVRQGQPPAKYFSHGFLVISVSLPLVILSIRLGKSIFGFGQFIGPVATILFTFTVMSFLCFVIGAQFSLACAVVSDKIKKGAALSKVYLCEALGAVIGGMLFTYVLIGSVPTFIIALIMSLGCILVYGILMFSTRPFGPRSNNISALGGSRRINLLKSISLIVAALVILSVDLGIEPIVNRIQWKRYQFVQQREARNATLSLVKMGSITNVFVDGMLSASFPDTENYESQTHWPLLATEEPGQILIMGDSSLGMLKEALKHDPGSVDYVVLDNSFLDLARPYLADKDISALEDPRINIHYSDPRIFVKNKEHEYDAVMMNIQEVSNLKLNRFYTQEFFTQIRSILKPRGILALSIASSENYLSSQTRMFNASVYHTLKSVFLTVEAIPGDSIMFLCGASAIDIQKETILERFSNRRISNRYVIPSHIEYKLATGRRIELKKLLEETPGVEINKDFKPTTYYYFTRSWLNKFTSPFGYLMGCLLIGSILFAIFSKRRSLIFLAWRMECVIIFILGFMGILLELILLLGFQIISGYVYWQIGMLFASFMSGLFLGSVLGSQFQYNSRQRHFNVLVMLSLTIIGLSICTGYFLPRLIDLSTVHSISIFLALMVVIGITVGASFVIAGFLIRENKIMVKSGSLYAADMWGAASGAILTTNFIIPVFGLLGALNFSAIMGSIGLVLFLVLSKDAR